MELIRRRSWPVLLGAQAETDCLRLFENDRKNSKGTLVTNCTNWSGYKLFTWHFSKEGPPLLPPQLFYSSMSLLKLFVNVPLISLGRAKKKRPCSRFFPWAGVPHYTGSTSLARGFSSIVLQLPCQTHNIITANSANHSIIKGWWMIWMMELIRRRTCPVLQGTQAETNCLRLFENDRKKSKGTLVINSTNWPGDCHFTMAFQQRSSSIATPAALLLLLWVCWNSCERPLNFPWKGKKKAAFQPLFSVSRCPPLHRLHLTGARFFINSNATAVPNP